jgi:heme exporter protein D
MTGFLDLGKHAGFIWAAYGASALVLAGLSVWIHFDAKRQAVLLADLERQGIRRRSAASSSRKKTRGSQSK